MLQRALTYGCLETTMRYRVALRPITAYILKAACAQTAAPHLGNLAECEAQHLGHTPGCWEQAPHVLALLQPTLQTM